GRATTTRRLAKLLIRMGNIGDGPAANTTLSIESSPYLGLPDLAAGTDDTGGDPDPFPCPPYCCLTCIVRSEVEPLIEFDRDVSVPQEAAPQAPGLPGFSEVCDGPDCHIEVFLGTQPANARGRILLGWYLDDLDLGLPLSITARFESDGDIYSPNDGSTYLFGPLYDQRLAITRPGSATTFSNTVELEGSAPPSASLQIMVDGAPASTVMADGQGQWWTTMGPIPRGAHLVRVVNQGGAGRLIDKSSPLLLFVNPDLLWDPASWSFTEGGRQIQPRDLAGRSDAEGWIVPLRPDVSLSSSIQIQCPLPVADVSLNFASIQVVYNDPEMDGTFEAEFQLPASLARVEDPVEARLNVTCGTDEFDYMGHVLIQELGWVFDVTTLGALDGASVGLLEEGLPWPGELYGQPNPALTGADGTYAFYPPPGTYQLYATKAGFQPYRSSEFDVQIGLGGRDLALVPLPAQRAGQPVPPPDIILGEAGFSLPMLAVPPGSVVEWFNADLAYHSIVGDGWDSGLLAGGEGFRRQFDVPGIYGYHDGENPLNQGLIFVDEAAARYAIYLPLVSK
ncbi:MAG: hypothetical protein PVJ34_20945, partial [Anaerolineae bacterium]